MQCYIDLIFSSLFSAHDDFGGSPTKKKKRKKKKHKHRDADGGDTSGTGGESNATTPATLENVTPSRKFDETDLSPVPTYGVVANTSKLSLKIFKKPVPDSSVLGEGSLQIEHRKKDKKKKNKNKDRDRKSRRDQHDSGADESGLSRASESNTSLPNATISFDLSQEKDYGASATVRPSLNVSSSFERLPGSTVIAQPANKIQLTQNSEAHPHPSSDYLTTGNEGLFDTFDSSANNIPYRQSQSQSTCSLPGTPASLNNRLPHGPSAAAAGGGLVSASIPTEMQNNAFPIDASLFDRLAADGLSSSQVSFLDHSGISAHDLVAATNCGVTPGSGGGGGIIGGSTSQGSSSGVCNLLEYASDFLQNEILSASNLCDTLPSSHPNDYHAQQQQHSFAASAGANLPSPGMLATSSHLNFHQPPLHSNNNDQAFNILGGILASSSSSTMAVDSSAAAAAAAFVNNFDIAGLGMDPGTYHHVPMGLASYLSSSSGAQQQSTVQKPNQPRLGPRTTGRAAPNATAAAAGGGAHKPWWERKAALPKNRRRLCLCVSVS